MEERNRNFERKNSDNPEDIIRKEEFDNSIKDIPIETIRKRAKSGLAARPFSADFSGSDKLKFLLSNELSENIKEIEDQMDGGVISSETLRNTLPRKRSTLTCETTRVHNLIANNLLNSMENSYGIPELKSPNSIRFWKRPSIQSDISFDEFLSPNDVFSYSLEPDSLYMSLLIFNFEKKVFQTKKGILPTIRLFSNLSCQMGELSEEPFDSRSKDFLW